MFSTFWKYLKKWSKSILFLLFYRISLHWSILFKFPKEENKRQDCILAAVVIISISYNNHGGWNSVVVVVGIILLWQSQLLSSLGLRQNPPCYY